VAGPVRISLVADAGPARKGLEDIASAAESAATKAETALDGIGGSIDGIDTSKAQRNLNDLGGGFDKASEASDVAEGRFQGLASTLTGTTDTAKGLAQIASGDVYGGLVSVGQGAADLAEGLNYTVIPMAKMIATSGVQKVSMLASAAATNVAAVATRGFGIALRFATGPVGLIIAGIALLVGALILAYKKSETFRSIVDGAFAAVKTTVGSVVKFFTGLPGSITKAVGNLKTLLTTKGKDLLLGLINGYLSLQLTVGKFFLGLPGKVVSWIGNVSKRLYNNGRQLLVGLINGYLSVFGNVGTFFRGLPGKAVSWVGDVSKRLYTKGSGLVGGLLNGSVSVAGRVGTFFSELPGKALSALGSVSTKLYSAGSNLLQGMINGVRAKAQSLINSVTAPVSDAISKAKGLLGISSPSRVFRDIGRQTVAGLTEGLSRTAAVERAAERLAQATTAGYGDVRLQPAVALAGTLTGASSAEASAAGLGGPLYLEAHIEIGGEVIRVVRTELKQANRELKRTVKAGAF
jgi:hypothetical protein